MTVGAAAHRPELVGREEELSLIEQFLQQAAGDGAALLFEGETGVGKTALLHAATDRAQVSGARVVRAQGVEFEATNTFAGLGQLLTPMTAGLGGLVSAQRDALAVVLGVTEGDPPDSGQVSRAALNLIRAEAADRPLVLVVDDIQWIDRYSASVLGFVVRRLAGSRVGVLAAVRKGVPSAFEPASLPSHELGPLPAEAADALLRLRYPTLAPVLCRRMLDEAQGNPLALLELPHALMGIQNTAWPSLPRVLPLTDRLQEIFAVRVTPLPAQTRAALLLAVLSGAAELAVLERATGGQLLDQLGPAERARLVRIDDTSRQVIFGHPLIRSAVVGLSTAAERRVEHQRLAAALHDQPDRRSWHLAEATAEPDEEVAAALEQSARRIRLRGDPVDAATLLARAAQLTPDPEKRSARLAETAFIDGTMSWQVGRVPSLLAEARRNPLGMRAALHAAAADAYLMLNGDEEIGAAHRLVVSTLNDYPGPLDAGDSAVIAALDTLFQVCIWGGRAELWPAYLATLARLTPAAPLGNVLLTEAFGDPVRVTAPTLRRLDDAVLAMRSEADPDEVGKLTSASVFVDRLAACREALRRLIRGEREGGAVTQAIGARGNLALDAFLSGRWDEADELVRAGAESCEANGHRLFAQNFGYLGGLLAAARGDHDKVIELADRLEGWGTPRHAHLPQFWACHIRMVDALGRADFELAYRHAIAISPPGTFPPHVGTALWVCLGLVEAASRTGRSSEAAAHAAAMRAAGLPAISPRLDFVTRACEAMTADADRIVELFDDVLSTENIGQWPFDLATVQLAYGTQLRHADATAAARVQLTAALATFGRLGAAPWTSRVEGELSALREAHDTGPLTAQEYEIAALAAAGLTNRQIGERLFLSHRTVSSYLYRIFPKLGIETRAALRDALSSLPPA
ncbi:LuxR family transcriptional regulator [Rhizocola hellebori]|uniref:LuxR family transcriptional regulator n=1 Tax=Rhizocola hellebori TaxID=1392758 RepID=A0A8J3QCZ8_9ACTN|nr:LuxR family transcriptional regulator [Rhizocola hellebori]GIH08504.1 LuxR family transcriptional regulator [Rhizocola hellebori]